MVIRHHYRHTKFFCQMDLINGRDSIIAGQDRIDSGFCCLRDQMLIHAITIPDPVWNDKIRLCPDPL